VIVLDEPVSALDVSIRSQVLNLLLDLQQAHGLTYLYIAHDLALLRHVTDRLTVMYRGRVVEEGESEAVLSAPRHPYSQALRLAVPGRDRREMVPRADEVVEAFGVSSGCSFLARCPLARARCVAHAPRLQPLTEGSGRSVACFEALGPDGLTDGGEATRLEGVSRLVPDEERAPAS